MSPAQDDSPARPEELAALVEAAAGPETQAAREELWRRMLASPDGPRAVLAALAQASGAALEAAGLWLFSPESGRSWELGLALARAGEDLLALARARPGEWCREGVASCLAMAGGRALAGLLRLARGEEWAAGVAAELPPGLALAGGDSPALRLSRDRLGRAGRKLVRRLAANRDWPALAGLGRDHLTLAQAQAGVSPEAAIAPALAWPGGDLSLLEDIAAITAHEGRIAAVLARDIARREARPVLLIGNASLGGPPLWATPGPWELGGEDLRPVRRPPAAAWAELAALRARRLAAPSLVRALWELRCAAAVRGRGLERLRGLLAQARPWLPPGQAEQILEGSLPLALGGLPLGQARSAAQAALARAQACVQRGRRALGLFYGLAAAGRPLALPWADKVVASTGKAADHLYLAELAALMARLSPPPLLLILDETIHPAAASFKVVLEAAARRRPELRLAGLGCFGGGDEPADLAAVARDAARGAHLLALRAAPRPHPVATLSERLGGRALGRPLSPASREGADYLLAGTALAGLAGAGPPSCPGEPAPWLLTGRGFAPVGSWLRARVGGLAGRSEPPSGRAGGFWRSYQELANLT